MFEYQLSPCKFCGGSSQELEVCERGKKWTAIIHCGGCELTIMPFYLKDTKEDAVLTIVERWNASPGSCGAEAEKLSLDLQGASDLQAFAGAN